MRISPAHFCTYNGVARHLKTFGQEKTESAVQPAERQQVTQLPNTTYYVMPSTDERIYTSASKELVDVPSNFKINAFDNVPCPACGRKMLPKEKFLEFQDKIDNADSNEYLGILGDYKDYMHPVELSVFEEISDISETTGEKDVRKLLESLRDTKLPVLQKVQMDKVKQMTYLAKSLPKNERKVLLKKIKGLQCIIYKKNSEAPFRRKILIDRISKINIKNKHKYDKLQQIVKSFPTSFDMNSAWIVKYSGKNKKGEDWNSHDIAMRMLCYSVPNTDHILARGIELNHDDLSNYMAMHMSCNTQKSSKPFLQWYFENKNLRAKSLKSYFEKSQELISSGQISDPRYKDYVANATQLIKEISKGVVDIKIDEKEEPKE